MQRHPGNPQPVIPLLELRRPIPGVHGAKPEFATPKIQPSSPPVFRNHPTRESSSGRVLHTHDERPCCCVAGFRHLRINHSKCFADGKNHINGIENFWNQAKCHLRKFNGVPKEHFPLFLKQFEWRFNNPNPQTQLKQLNQWVQQLLT